MHRYRAIQIVMDQIEDEIVVSNIGDPSKELYNVKDRLRNFYMLGSMGLASSISLGIALSKKENVVCLDGDGALLMNLGSLATIANYNPKNFVLIILDNGTYGTTGNQPSFTSGITDLGKIARACGFKHCYSATDEKELIEAVFRSLNDNNLSFIHVKVKPDDMKLNPVPIEPITLKNRFMDTIKTQDKS